MTPMTSRDWLLLLAWYLGVFVATLFALVSAMALVLWVTR